MLPLTPEALPSETLCSMGMVQQLVALVRTEHSPFHEHVLGALCRCAGPPGNESWGWEGTTRLRPPLPWDQGVWGFPRGILTLSEPVSSPVRGVTQQPTEEGDRFSLTPPPHTAQAD